MGITIGLTGCSSNLGQGLLETLMGLTDVDDVKGLDIAAPEFEHDKFTYIPGDVRNEEDVAKCFDGADVVIHLAFIVFVVPESFETAVDVNINGTKQVFSKAVDLGIQKIIYLSSAASYGIHDDRDLSKFPLKEDDDLRGDESNHFYLYSKGKVENYIVSFREEFPDIIITHIRPHIIVGPSFYDTINLKSVRNDLQSGSISHVKKSNESIPMNQYTDEEDLLRFIEKAILQDLDGPYNIVGDPVNMEEYAQKHDMKFSTLPYWLVAIVARFSYWFGSTTKVEMQWLVLLKYAFLLDNSKVKEVFPNVTSTEEILDKLREHLKQA